MAAASAVQPPPEELVKFLRMPSLEEQEGTCPSNSELLEAGELRRSDANCKMSHDRINSCDTVRADLEMSLLCRLKTSLFILRRL